MCARRSETAERPEPEPDQPHGSVTLVGTPIGNLGDLSKRATEVLSSADVVCCEDTRRTRVLLSAAGVRPRRLLSLHEHNESSRAEYLVELAAAGQQIAVVSDAGMPGISDPGERLVRVAIEAGVGVTSVPGPTALATALVLSGLDAARFAFEGFLPKKGREREERLRAVARAASTTVLYEAPHRAVQTLTDLREACGEDREVAVARELTKLHEEVWRGDLGGAVAWAESSPPRGEWVVVVSARRPAEVTEADIVAALSQALESGDDRRQAVAAVTDSLGAPRNQVYRLSLEFQAGRKPGS